MSDEKKTPSPKLTSKKIPWSSIKKAAEGGQVEKEEKPETPPSPRQRGMGRGEILANARSMYGDPYAAAQVRQQLDDLKLDYSNATIERTYNQETLSPAEANARWDELFQKYLKRNKASDDEPNPEETQAVANLEVAGTSAQGRPSRFLSEDVQPRYRNVLVKNLLNKNSPAPSNEEYPPLR